MASNWGSDVSLVLPVLVLVGRPSAGSEVLLHNGEPLYGEGAPPSLNPMQRTTKTVIDSAGNLWAVNNWKNEFGIDNPTNPGGDGVVIFVGSWPLADRLGDDHVR